MDKTTEQYTKVIEACKEIFEKKTKDYGTAWRILRLPSITDQIFIKAQRIRSIQEKGEQKVEDGINQEFVGTHFLLQHLQIKLALTLHDARSAIPSKQFCNKTNIYLHLSSMSRTRIISVQHFISFFVEKAKVFLCFLSLA